MTANLMESERVGFVIAPEQIAYVNARLIDPGSGLDTDGALVSFDQKIQAVGPNLFPEGVPQNLKVIDCRGKILCPGLIDMRVFTGEPGAEHQETLASASRAAAAGGVTTMIVMPDTEPTIDDVSLVDFIKRRSRDTAVVRVFPMAALTKGLKGEQLTEMGLLQEAGAVGFTDGRRSLRNSGLMRTALSYARIFDALIAHHAEDDQLTGNGTMNEGEFAARLGLNGIPNAAETVAVLRDLELVRLTGSRYHLAQVSCARALAAIEQAKADGLRVTCAVSAHHLALNELDVGDYRTFSKTSPPLRAEEDRRAMVDGLARGSIDVIVSSHDPQAPENKRLPFSEATPGTVGLETMLAAVLEQVHAGNVDLMTALKSMTQTPADILGLSSGKLAAEAPADFIIFDPDEPIQVDSASLKSKSKNTPFDGRRLQGRVLRTVVGGQSVYDAELTDA